MTRDQFKKALQAELSAGAISFRNPLKDISELNTFTCLKFAYPVDEDTKQWLNSRFTHGISDTNTDATIIFINNPFTYYH